MAGFNHNYYRSNWYCRAQEVVWAQWSGKLRAKNPRNLVIEVLFLPWGEGFPPWGYPSFLLERPLVSTKSRRVVAKRSRAADEDSSLKARIGAASPQRPVGSNLRELSEHPFSRNDGSCWFFFLFSPA